MYRLNLRMVEPCTVGSQGILDDADAYCRSVVLDETGISSTTEEQRWSAIGTVLRYRLYDPEEGSIRFMVDRSTGGN